MVPQWIDLTPEEEATLDEAREQVLAEYQAKADAEGVTVDELLAREAAKRPPWRNAATENDDQLAGQNDDGQDTPHE